jgi:DeoR/GlpR family transcriptional regulator of sugar metabolism
MNRTKLFHKIEQMLHERRVVSVDVFLDELDISRATFKREMESQAHILRLAWSMMCSATDRRTMHEHD